MEGWIQVVNNSKSLFCLFYSLLSAWLHMYIEDLWVVRIASGDLKVVTHIWFPNSFLFHIDFRILRGKDFIISLMIIGFILPSMDQFRLKYFVLCGENSVLMLGQLWRLPFRILKQILIGQLLTTEHIAIRISQNLSSRASPLQQEELSYKLHSYNHIQPYNMFHLDLTHPSHCNEQHSPQIFYQIYQLMGRDWSE